MEERRGAAVGRKGKRGICGTKEREERDEGVGRGVDGG